MGAVAHIEDYKDGRYFQKQARGDMSWNGYETNVLLHNLGNDANGIPRYTDVALPLGAGDLFDSRGTAFLDYDNDGDLDIAVSHNPGDLYPNGVAPALYRNDVGNQQNWLVVELEGVTSNRDAIGAKVVISTEAGIQLRVKKAGSGYASQQSGRIHFGLGQATSIDSLKVVWPAGETTSYGVFDANQVIAIKEGQAPVLRLSADP